MGKSLDPDPRNDPLLRDVPDREGYKCLGGCVLYQTLGRGGFGTVFRGHHLRLDVDVAVKCLEPALVQRDESFVQRFLREAQAAARVNNPNVVRVFDVDEEHGVHYLVMELVEGESAGRRVQRKGPLSVEEGLLITLGLARGLAAAHAAGLVHRDVKPDNLLISSAGEVKLADLGLVRPEDTQSGLTASDSALGTPRYMPPEQFHDASAVGPPADVYAMGATLYFLLVGREGIVGETIAQVLHNVLQEPYPALAAELPDAPDSLCEFVARCTSKEVGERPANGAEAAALLEELTAGFEMPLADPGAGGAAEGLVSPPPQDTLAGLRAAQGGSSGRGSGVRAAQAQGGNRLSLEGGLGALGCNLKVAVTLGVLLLVAVPVWRATRSPVEDTATSLARLETQSEGAGDLLVMEGAPASSESAPYEMQSASRGSAGETAPILRITDGAGLSKGREPDLDVTLGAALKDVTLGAAFEDDGAIVVGTDSAIEVGADGDWSDATKRALGDQGKEGLMVELPAGWESQGSELRGGHLLLRARDPATGIVFLGLPGGRFEMGSADEAAGAEERPRHEVEISRAFWLAQEELTQAQWSRFMEANPSAEKDDSKPLEGASWDDCQDYLRRAGPGYRLPTEAEWEYACGFLSSPLPGDDPVFLELRGLHTAPAEWCLDVYDPGYYGRSGERDPVATGEGAGHAVRGAGDPGSCTRRASLEGAGPGVGLRPVFAPGS